MNKAYEEYLEYNAARWSDSIFTCSMCEHFDIEKYKQNEGKCNLKNIQCCANDDACEKWALRQRERKQIYEFDFQNKSEAHCIDCRYINFICSLFCEKSGKDVDSKGYCNLFLPKLIGRSIWKETI